MSYEKEILCPKCGNDRNFISLCPNGDAICFCGFRGRSDEFIQQSLEEEDDLILETIKEPSYSYPCPRCGKDMDIMDDSVLCTDCGCYIVNEVRNEI